MTTVKLPTATGAGAASPAAAQPKTASENISILGQLRSLSEKEALPAFRRALKDGTKALYERFDRGEPVTELVKARSDLVDQVITAAVHRFLPSTDGIAIAAVGGYGRAELHPASDIDILILTEPGEVQRLGEPLTALVTFLWDIGLELGHSVRTIDECVEEAVKDATVMTNLLEARLILGNAELYAAMGTATEPDEIWPSDRFFKAKIEERSARWSKYGETAYNLEPNIKENPGGLRDIQMIGWVARRHFGITSLRELIAHGCLTETELLALLDGQALLWRIRFALHRLVGRREDRLLFDYQRTLARQFGYSDSEHSLAVEQFMQQYYRTVMELNRLNEMLLQLFEEVILLHDRIGPPTRLNKRFQTCSGFLEVTRRDTFQRRPFALLEVFHLLQLHPDVRGIRASTIRLIRESRHLIDDSFREDLRTRSLFMEILRHPEGLSNALRRMNEYGVLAAYIPAFANVVGRMQYDLYHVYTVDEHSLRLLRNLRRLSAPEHRHELPLCSAIVGRIPKLELLYLSGLFHDIAKGRGGDHSLLGARDAWDFCQLHGLSEFDSRLVAWLVEHHLLMSMTAQRRDIADPEVIQAFAEQVADANRLNYLYLLTVADVRATNPKRWNSWIDSLLKELYRTTMRALERGLDNPHALDDLIAEKQSEAMRLLARQRIDADACRDLWSQVNPDFFTASAPEEIAWQSREILETSPGAMPKVAIRPLPARGCSEVFIYSQDQAYLFVRITALLDQHALNIVDARITTTAGAKAINVFRVLNQDGKPIPPGEATERLAAELHQELLDVRAEGPRISRRVPRQLRSFPVETRINFDHDQRNGRTLMRLLTRDRPGLLAEVGEVFERCEIRLHSAKIATIGAEVEDVFFISDADAAPVTCQDTLACLRRAIHDRLEGGGAA
jgi:[protein-PII] uridylyltransferase